MGNGSSYIDPNLKAITDKKAELLILGPSPVINQINGMTATRLDQIKPDMTTYPYNPPPLKPLLTNNCNSYSDSANINNTNSECLRALIETCNTDITNQNNVISNKNCLDVKNYAKSYAVQQQRTNYDSIEHYKKNDYTDWTASGGGDN